jgi:hypothetical protein
VLAASSAVISLPFSRVSLGGTGNRGYCPAPWITH